VSETICIRSLYSRVFFFIPVGGYIINITIRVSKGVHNIVFTVSPDTIHFISRCLNNCTKTAGDILYSTNTTQYSKPKEVAPNGC
jgi:hypothetical protein